MGPIVWFTGLSGSGKSTIARAVASELRKRNIPFEVLDGDVVRAKLCNDLGFSKADRCENLRRISFVAGILSRHDIVVLVAAISPYRDIRSEIRKQHPSFIEAFINAPLEVCEQRDPKGLYRKARSGAVQSFTGISDAYEAPLQPHVECRTDLETVDHSCAKILRAIDAATHPPGAWQINFMPQTADSRHPALSDLSLPVLDSGNKES